MKLVKPLVSLAASVVASSCAFGLETAEALIVKIDMSNLSTSTDGDYIGTWVNQATGELAASDFAPCTEGKGPVYVADAGGRPGVYFNGSADSTMESPSALPSTILGGDTWSAEAWVYTPTRLASKTYFTWTRRGGGNQLVELRYGNDNGNAVEHNSNNVPWGGLPAEGNWHYVAITRDEAGYENLYLDGVRVSGKDAYTALNIRNNGHFTLGGTKTDNGNFDGGLLYTGYVGAIRVHAGTLTAAQVAANYIEECRDYRAAWKGGDDSWSNASAWGLGVVPAANADVSFANGGTATVDNVDVAVKWVNLIDGTIVVDNGGSFAINAESNINLAKGSGATNGTFILRNGTFSPNRRVDGAELGATLDMVIGEHGAADGTAVAVFPNEFHLAVNGTGRLVIEDGADITTKGWFTTARYNSSAVGSVTMNGGSLKCQSWFLVSCHKGRGEFIMNGGHVLADGVEFTYGDNDANQYGNLYLNGGVFEYNYTQLNNTAGNQAIYFDGGTIRARRSEGNFIRDGFDVIEVRAGGAYIDVPGVFAVDVANQFTQSSESPNGVLVKLGTGRLNFKDSFAYAGTIELRDGVTKFSSKSNLAGATLKVEKGAAVMCTEAGGMAELLSHITADSEGTILISGSNLSDNVDLSGHPKLQVGFFGTSGEYTGTITYYPGTAHVLSFNTLSGACDINNTLSDIGGEPTALHLVGTPGTAGKLVLKKDSTFTGGIVVDAAMLQFDTALGMGTTGPIRLVNGGELVLNHGNIDVQAVIDRITADSDGALVFCGNSKKDLSFSLAGHPGLYVGSYPGHDFDYTGRITPDDPNEYHFGGGHQSYTHINGGFKYNPAIEDAGGQPTTVVFGKPGVAMLKGTNGYTGGTVVTNDATIYFSANEAAYGATPAEADPDNFYFDGGNFRSHSMSMSLSATRGVTVGPNGAKFHVWGGYTFTIKGSLHGTGPILVSDTGTLVFAGEANDFSGTLATSSAAIQIGDDECLNWDFDAVMPEITGNGRLIIGVPAETSYTFDKSAGSGSGWFGKAGTGTLVLTAKQKLASTSVKAGTLVVPFDDVIGSGQLDVASGSTLELRDGVTIHVNSLTGAGTVTAPAGAEATLVVGVSNGGGAFSGTISPNVKVVKSGTGTQTLVLGGNLDDVEVNAGTLYLTVYSSIGRVAVAPGAKLVLTSAEARYVSVGDMSAVQGSVSLEGGVKFAYNVGEGVTVENPAIVTPDSDQSELAKDGKGTLVWSLRGEGTYGVFNVMDGTLALREATSVGSLVIEESATVTVSPKKNADYRGLSIRYYDSTDNTYNEVSELGRMHTFFEETLTPTIVTNSYVLGSSTFSTDGTPAYREPGKYSTGQDNYYVYATGQIYLPYDGQYAFGFTADDGVSLFLDGVRRYFTTGQGSSNSGWFTVSKGFHTYEWSFRENGGGQYFHASIMAKDASGNPFDKWASWENLPQELLYPEFSRVAGLSGAGTLDLGRGMLLVEQYVDGVFSGTVEADSDESEGVTAYLVKKGRASLTLSGAVAANVVASEGVLALEPEDDAEYADVVAESGATVSVNASCAVSIGRLRGKGVLRVDGGATVTADADGFEGTVLVVNGKFAATATTDDTTLCKYKVVTKPSENATAVAGVAGTPSGDTLPYADVAASAAAVEVANARAVVLDAASLSIGGATSDVTVAGLRLQKTDDYGLWQFNEKAEEWVGLDGEKGFLILPGGVNWVGSVYLKEKVNVTLPWRMTWTYVATKGAGNQWGDGVAFVIQNDSAGANLCDTACTGNKLGGPCSTAHPLSAAFWWNLYQKESCGWAQKGVKGAETTLLNNPSDADRHTLQGYDLDIAYNGAGVMSCRIFYQGEEVYATTQAIDMADVIGGNDENWDGMAYVGFSAATGGSGAFMKVQNVAWYTARDPDAPNVYNEWVDADIADPSLWQRNGTITTDSNGTKMCVGSAGNTCSSMYLKEKRDIRGVWKSHWTFKATKGSVGEGWGDGVCFALQDDDAGAELCSGVGSSLGGPCSTEHPRSVAFWWNLYKKESCGWAVKGAHTTDTTLLNNPGDGARRTPNGYELDIEHDGEGNLKCTITYQGVVVHTDTQSVDFEDVFGAEWDGKAYFGFSAAMGGSSSDAWVDNVTWSDLVEFSDDPVVTDISVMSSAAASLCGISTNDVFGALVMDEGAALTLKANAMALENEDYAVTVSELCAVGGQSAISLADNGTGKGTLKVGRVVYDGGAVRLSGGSLAAAGDSLEVVVTDPKFRNRVNLVSFADGATWSGPVPEISVADAEGHTLRAVVKLTAKGLRLSPSDGFSVIIR